MTGTLFFSNCKLHCKPSDLALSSGTVLSPDHWIHSRTDPWIALAWRVPLNVMLIWMSSVVLQVPVKKSSADSSGNLDPFYSTCAEPKLCVQMNWVTVVLDAPASLSCTILLNVVVFSLVPDWGLSSGSTVGSLNVSEKLVFQALNCSLIQGCDISWSVVSCEVSTGRPNDDLPPSALFLGFAIWSLSHEELARKPLNFDIEVEWRWFCFP